MKVTEPIDVYLADKLFQLTGRRLPRPAATTTTARRSPARPSWSSAAATASAPTSPSWPRRTARTWHVQPLHDPTHVERRGRHRRGRTRCARAVRVDRLRGQHRRGAAPRRPGGHLRGDDLRGDRDQLRGAGADRAGVPPASGRERRAACCSSPRARTRAAAAATASTPRRRPRSSTSRRRWPTSGRRTAYGSTASIPSAPALRCAPRRSATNRPTHCSSRRW